MNKKYDLEYKKIGLNIAYYRKLKGLTQLQLAELANLSRTHISYIEGTGTNTSLSLESLFAIADALEIPAYKLLVFPTEE